MTKAKFTRTATVVCIVYNVKSVQWEQSHFLYVVLALWGKTTMWAVGYEVNDQKLIRRCRFYFPSNFGNKYTKSVFLFFSFFEGKIQSAC